MPVNPSALDSVLADNDLRTAADARPELPMLTDVLAAIAVDAQSAPETYLRETEVPHGGE